jgi:chitinase
VAASNYKPGVYCPASDIAVIAPLVTAYNVQFWANTWSGRTPNPDGSVGPIVSSTTTQFLTTDPTTGQASATSLQYGAGYSIQTVNGPLDVDLDTSSLYGGSSPPDTTPPTVSISSPASGTTYTTAQTVVIMASASDNVGVTKVDFYDNTSLIDSVPTAPYAHGWAITSANNGAHNWTARAYDAVGNVTASAVVSLTVNIPGGGGSSPMISSPKLTGTTFTLSVPTQVVSNYTLEYKNTFSDANWTAVQTLAGTGGTITLTDTTATGSSRLYHVRVH